MTEKATKKHCSLRGGPSSSNGRINIARENLHALVEQVAIYSGAADEDLISQRIAAPSK